MQDFRQIEDTQSNDLQPAARRDEQFEVADAPLVLDDSLLAQIGGGYTNAPNTTW